MRAWVRRYWFPSNSQPQTVKAKMQRIAKHIIFTGRVQGVGFRFTARHSAERHQLTGFVRNLPDGTVEMLAQGPREDVDSCLEDIKDSFAGYIRETRVEEAPLSPQYTAFGIRF